MSAEAFEIIEAGLLTTVQDRGRYGHQRSGVPVSGAMDQLSLRAANIMVGNDEGAACLEMTVVGPRIRFLVDTWIAVTGGDLSPVLDGEPMPQWRTVEVHRNGILSFHGARDGTRAYVAIAGGIDVKPVMGSRSTYLKGGIGGLDGRAVRPGDVLSVAELDPDTELVLRGIPEGVAAPSFGHDHEIRVVLGPQHSAFTADGIATFLGSTYQVSLSSDRMGYRLEGPAIKHESGSDIVSDGSPLGAVQVPGDGHPIILLADRGTTGGYTKIATVISTDVNTLGQAMLGDTVTFKSVTVEDAHNILREEEDTLKEMCRELGVTALTPRLRIMVGGKAFEVVDDTGMGITVVDLTGGPESSESHRAKATVDGRTYEFEIEVQKGLVEKIHPA